MSIVRTQGVVLRYTNFKEADRMLTIFSPDKGKMQVLARGCRKPKSRILAASQLFCYGDYIFYKTKELYIMTQTQVKDSFFDIRTDMGKLAYGSYILNLTEEAVNYEERNYRLFYLLLQSLTYLSYGDMEPQDITHVFELKLIDLLGYRPVLEKCIICDRVPENNPIFFDISQGGIICSKCNSANKYGYNIHMSTLQTMRYILDMDMRRLGILKFSNLVRNELNQVLANYLSQRLEKSVRSRKFIEQLRINR
jgi:DNA repair protein RecO (recombination protein O)